MEGKEFEMNNEVALKGEIIPNFRYSHEVFGKKFYTFDLNVNRISQNKDIIPIIIEEKLLASLSRAKKTYVEIRGKFRSYNRQEENKSKLILYVLAQEVLENDEEDGNNNIIFLQGFICRPVTYRKTPLGIEITDLLVAVNRPFGKSDYIPCITWGEDARNAANLEVGNKIMLYGRIQSRIYQKKYQRIR